MNQSLAIPFVLCWLIDCLWPHRREMAHRQGRRNDHHAGQSSAGPESPRTFQDASGPGQIDVLKPKLDIGNTVLPGILRSFFNHLRGHVHTDDLSFPSYTAGGKEAVEARPTAQIENGLAGLEGCQGERISAAEPQVGSIGHRIQLLFRGADPLANLQESTAVATTRSYPTAGTRSRRDAPVFFTHYFLYIPSRSDKS